MRRRHGTPAGFGDRTTRQASLRAGRSTPRRPPSTLAPSAEGASDHARQRQAVGDFDRRDVVLLGGLVRWRHSEDPDRQLRHRLEGGGRARRLLPGDRRRHLPGSRARCRRCARADRRSTMRSCSPPAGSTSTSPPNSFGPLNFVQRKYSDGGGRGDLPKRPVGADRASGAGERQFRRTEGQADHDRLRHAHRQLGVS